MNTPDVNKINKSALEFNKAVAPALKSIAQPLFTYAGITHLTYNKFLPGQNYLTVSLDCNLVESYLRQNLDRHAFFDVTNLPTNSKRVVFWDTQKDNDLLDFLRSNNYSHGLSIFLRHEELIEAWHFSTDNSNSEINQFYLNEQELIEKFMVSFVDKAKDIISTDDVDKLAIYHEGRSLDLSMFDAKEHGQLHELLKVNNYPLQYNGYVTHLTQRELNCLQELAQGLSAKLIAIKLGISPRTVETYLLNIKTKLNLYSKHDLLEVFKQSIYSKLQS